MTGFCQTDSLSRPFWTLSCSIILDPTPRSLCGVIEIQPLVYLHREIISIFAK